MSEEIVTETNLCLFPYGQMLISKFTEGLDINFEFYETQKERPTSHNNAHCRFYAFPTKIHTQLQRR